MSTVHELPVAAASPTSRPPTKRRASAIRRSERNAGLILVAPALLFFTVFMFIPLALTF